MSPFRFRLAKVLDWYHKQSQLETERLRVCVEHVTRTRLEIERNIKDVLARQTEVIGSAQPLTQELAALGPYRRAARNDELRLRLILQQNERNLEQQRVVCQAAQRRLRLVEKLRERRLAEHDYEASRELEELASEAFLARFARELTETVHPA